MTGTQISSFFKKNLRKGKRRLNWYCSARISTQLWWLLVTSQEWVISSFSKPSTSHSIGCTACIQKRFTEIHDSATQCMIKRMPRWIGVKGRINFNKARINSGQHQNKVLVISNTSAIEPRKNGGRTCNIEAIPRNNALGAAEIHVVFYYGYRFCVGVQVLRETTESLCRTQQ